MNNNKKKKQQRKIKIKIKIPHEIWTKLWTTNFCNNCSKHDDNKRTYWVREREKELNNWMNCGWGSKQRVETFLFFSFSLFVICLFLNQSSIFQPQTIMAPLSFCFFFFLFFSLLVYKQTIADWKRKQSSK